MFLQRRKEWEFSQIILLMRQKGKRSIKLPEVKERSLSYALHSINVAAGGCYDNSRRLRMDEGFGDYNMRLFRLKDKKKYVKTVPSAFTPAIRRLLHYSASDPREKRIATEHNEQIEKILDEPKEVYLEMIRQEREAQEGRRLEELRRNEFVKGEDAEVREHNEQLTFNYLPKYQANQWFKTVDRSPTYLAPTPLSFNISAVSFSSTPKQKVRRGHIFLSDDKSRSFMRSKG